MPQTVRATNYLKSTQNNEDSVAQTFGSGAGNLCDEAMHRLLCPLETDMLIHLTVYVSQTQYLLSLFVQIRSS